jgi:uncharacterized protein (DUF2062 family)
MAESWAKGRGLRMSPSRRASPVRPWWRNPLKFLLRARLRRRQVHGTLLHRMMGERLFAPELWIPNRESTARGLAWGMLIGFLPLPFLQTVSAVALCYFTRSNVAAAVLATLITNPFTFAPIAFAQRELGHLLMGWMQFMPAEYAGMGRYFSSYVVPFLVGSAVSAVVLALLTYPLALWIWSLVEAAIRRHRKRVAEIRRAAEARLTAKENAEE